MTLSSLNKFDMVTLQHGGTVVQNPGPETHMVLVNKLVARANNIIK